MATPTRIAALVLLLLAALACSVAAQDEATEPVYLVVDYMKARNVADYENMETMMWQPLHQVLVDDGRLNSWALYWVQFGDRSEYDYVTVQSTSSLEYAMGGLPDDFEDVLRRAHPHMRMDDLRESVVTRDMVRSEIWVLDPEASIPSEPFTSIQVDYMHVEPGNEEAYLAVERGLWKPIHERLIADGISTGWGTYQMLYPLGTSQPYNFGTVTTHSAWQSYDFVSTAEAVHPDMTWTEIATQTEATRALVKGQIWSLIASTTSPEAGGN